MRRDQLLDGSRELWPPCNPSISNVGRAFDDHDVERRKQRVQLVHAAHIVMLALRLKTADEILDKMRRFGMRSHQVYGA